MHGQLFVVKCKRGQTIHQITSMRLFTYFSILFLETCYSFSNDLQGILTFRGVDKLTVEYGNITETCSRHYHVRQIEAPPTDKPSDEDIQELVKGLGRFLVKHMYMDGYHGSFINSYDELTGNPLKLREYLVELNLRLFKGRVLPMIVDGVGDVQKWIKQAKKRPKKVSLVDAYIDDIQADIIAQEGFKKYFDRIKKGEKVPDEDGLFTTEREYPITEIVESIDADGNLIVRLERHKSKITIGMNGKEVYHYHGTDAQPPERPKVINDRTVTSAATESPISSDPKHETKFTSEELEQIAKLTFEFQKEAFGVESIKKLKALALNDKSKRYYEAVGKFQKQFEEIIGKKYSQQEQVITKTPGACARGAAGKKKRAGSSCAFYIDPEGEVESIHPEEFMEIYEGTAEEGRRRMTDIIKNNGDKFVVEDEANWLAARKRLNQLVHHEEMTAHGGAVETTGTIQDWRRWKTPVPSKASEMVTAIHDAVAARMNKVRLSGTKVVYSLAKNPHINGIVEAGRPYGHLMMAKGIINGIIHNDTTALAVIGSRFGYDIVTDVAVNVGTKFFSAASKVGKTARVLGKVAGPVGAVLDVGLGVWSLTKSVDRLKDAKNSYDRDDAIADIVSESVDITVAITTTALSLAFPPAAPLFLAVGLIINIINSIATSIFHATNEVNRINAEIPLSGSEKEHVFTSRLFDFFGLREKDYIDYLVEEKHANDAVVKSYLDFLKENEQFMGVVFPSRTLAYDGGCHLVMYDCLFGTWLGRPACKGPLSIGRNCDWNGPCASNGRLCVTQQTEFQYYDCICDNKPETTFGVAHRNSYVDFRRKQKLFWERAVPGDVPGAEFKCKPSSLNYEDFRIHQKDPKEEYHCQHAIGLYRPQNERKEGQSFLVNLEDGNDDVMIDQFDDTTPYTFLMGEEGEKSFVGGNKRNEFILNGNCSNGMLKGSLFGGPQDTDSLVIAPTCGKGKIISIEHEGKSVKLENKLNLQMSQIENIIGRPQEAETLVVGCGTRRVVLNGGVSIANPDYIAIEQLGCYDVQIVLASYTHVNSNADKGDVTIYVGKEMSGSMIYSTLNAYDKQNPPKTTVIFTQTNSERILLDNIEVSRSAVLLKIKDNPSSEPLTIKFTDFSRVNQLFFNESSKEAQKSFSVLMVPGNENVAKKSPLMFYHSLQSHLAPMNKKARRVGSDSIPNVFNVSAGNWYILGGSKDDTFLVNVPIKDTFIHGGGGQDTLILLSPQTEPIELNKAVGNLQGIETVVKGEQAGRIEITTGCDTKAVVVKGKDASSPDIVRITDCCTSANELQIDAGGATLVLVDDEEDPKQIHQVVQILAHSIDQQPVRFELDTRGVLVPRMSVQIPLSHSYPPLSVIRESSRNGNTVRFKLTGAGLDHAILNFIVDDDTTNPFVNSPRVQLIPPQQDSPFPVQLVFRLDKMDPVIVHVIQEDGLPSSKSIVKGFEGIENLYQIFERDQKFEIHGGKVRDTFIGTSKALSFGVYNGDWESDNTLVVREDAQHSPESEIPFQVDLEDGWMSLLSNENNKKAIVNGAIHNVIGRANQPDVIVAGCATRTIAGKGGLGNNLPDVIVIKNIFCEDDNNIQSNHSSSLEVHLGHFTNVENSAETGAFKYFVDLTRKVNDVSFSLNFNENTLHKVVFTMSTTDGNAPPPVQFEYIKFDETLAFHAKDESGRSTSYVFQMDRKNAQSDYSNPTFLITNDGENRITSDVRVGGDGSTVATTLLEGKCQLEVGGLPVNINNILVNVKSEDDGSGKCGKVAGHADSLENHFWLYDVPVEKRFQIEGPASTSGQVSRLHLGENFHGSKPVTVNLSPVSGYVKRHGINTVLELRNVSSLVGRSSSSSYDTAIPSCSTKQISGVDLVSILLDPTEDCAYDLIIGVEPLTRIQFSWIDESSDGEKNLFKFWNSIFHYRFSEPQSFEVVQSYPGMLYGTGHKYYLPFDLDRLEALNFDEEDSKLYYSIDGEKYYITMISEPDDGDQFYQQPNMVTKDGFSIQVGRDEGVLITGVLQNKQTIKPHKLFSKFQEMANSLTVTMVIKTDSEFMHVGHNGVNSDRNVVQNLGYSQSYLGGGGAADTIYEVVKLNRDVFIDTGLENTFSPPAVNLEGPYIQKQTLDLSDIVTPLRLQAGYKYKPSVVQRGDDLVVSMENYKNQFPGEVVIYGGVKEQVRTKLQILLSNAMMEFVPSGISASETNTWQLSPVELQLEREMVYSIAAEDMEYGHHVVVLDHKYGPEYFFRFNYSRNGEDLHLSDIEEFSDHKYDQQHIEMTTLIITDFYKEANSATINEKTIASDAPAEIRDVTIFMPGLKVKLNGTEVLLLSNESEADNTIEDANSSNNNLSFIPVIRKFSSTTKKTTTPVLLSTGLIPSWTNVLHQVEDTILEGLPFVRRVY